MCLGAIYWARPARIFYAASSQDVAQAGFDDSFIARQLSLSPEDRMIPMLHLDAEESLAPFQAWAAQTRKIPY